MNYSADCRRQFALQLQQLPELGQVQGDNVALGLRGGGAAGTGGCCVVLSDLGVKFKERGVGVGMRRGGRLNWALRRDTGEKKRDGRKMDATH